MQQTADVLNLTYDRDDKEFVLLDEDLNLIKSPNNLKDENRLYDIISKIVNDDIIDQSLVEHNVEDIFLFLIEKIYLTENPVHHRMDWFKGPLNSKTKKNILIAFNKFITSNLEKLMNSKVIISYD